MCYNKQSKNKEGISVPDNPLAEVFGFPIDNQSHEAKRYRRGRLCPFNNKVPNCTKDKAIDPLGVCSILVEDGSATITCPIRFRENWIIAEDAAAFFFSPDTSWTSLTEVRLKDGTGQSAGNIDVVLVSYDEKGKLLDFGSLEVQAVYISGNVRNPFAQYMKDPDGQSKMVWNGHNYPRADYLSSSRKRLAPQMLYKGGIFNEWRKKQAVALHKSFYATLPELPAVAPEQADVAWFLYGLELNKEENRFVFTRHKTIYTAFEPALLRITKTPASPIDDFIQHLQ
ncbi:NotI family restriction endonuclease [Candidatus Magnetominusculus dajiuhuensis]|uniref:NotI family restriction endonuclease n=1 Tax=Candidatus Magnetominusculus dajiuhuensis TaxID=3137712 RepID=UPI003B437328